MRLHPARAVGLLRAPWIPGWSKDPLWRRARAVPSLDLRFADNKSLVDATTGQNLIDFSRASSATYVGSDGLIKTATTNYLLRSEEFANAAWTAIRANPVDNTATAPNGKLTASTFTATDVDPYIFQTVSLPAGTYTFSVYIKAKSGNSTNNLRLRVADATLGVLSSSILTLATEWQRFQYTVECPNGITQVRIDAPDQTGAAGDVVYLWGAQLEESSTVGEYIPTTSSINSAPRFDHDPTTGESLGLLVEEQRTNLLLRSEEFDNAAWVKFTSTVSANATTSPSGTVTADKLIEDTSANEHQITVSFSLTSGTSYTVSTYVKAAERTFVRFGFTGTGFASFTRSIFNLSTGTIAANAGGNPVITPVGNGWYRLSVTNTATSTRTGLVILQPALDASTVSYTGDGTSGIYIWGAQLEEGSFPTSYIKNVDTPGGVTRAADVAEITGTNFSSWYRQDEGTVFVEGAVPVGVSSSRTLLSIDNGTNAERIQIRHNSTTARTYIVADNGSTQFNSSLVVDSFPPGEYRKLAIVVKANDFAAVVDDAGTVDTGTGTMPTPTQLQIGNAPANPQPCKPIKRLTYWPQRLGNEVLQRITQ